MNDPLAVGIDLGTTNSVIAWIDENNVPQVIKNREGETITPSVVQMTADGPIVGTDAKDAMADGDPNAAAFFKRSMGDYRFSRHLMLQDYSSTDLSTIVLQKLKSDAEAQLGKTITHAVITVPADFTDPQRQATIEAGQRAGLEVLEIINEPTAAAHAYGLHDTGREELVLVYDLGGGTFDVTLVHITSTAFRVAATAGDHELGGKDWDDTIARYLLERYREELGVDAIEEGLSPNEVMVIAEKAKRKLTSVESTTLKLSHNGHHLKVDLSAEEFESRTRDSMITTGNLCEQVLKESNTTWKDITGVLLVGGSTRMPMVVKYVEKMSGLAPLAGINQDHAVALGAAVRAARCLNEQTPHQPRFRLPGPSNIQDVISHPLGMIAESPDGKRYVNSVIVNKNIEIPCTETRPFQLRTQAGEANELEVYITQGESQEPSECTITARWSAADVQHDAASELQVIDVSYGYTKNGTIQVSAAERASGRQLTMVKESEIGDLSWIDRPPKRTGGHMTAYIAIDLSYSMSGEGLRTAEKAALEFIRESDLSQCSIGLVEFADRTQIACEACQNARELEAKIKEMDDHLENGAVGFGNASVPFSTIQAALQDAADPRFIIVLTDGIWAYQDKAIAEAGQCRDEGIQIIAIGTESADIAFLEKLTSSDESAFYAKQDEVVSMFGSIARELTETAGGSTRSLKLK